MAFFRPGFVHLSASYPELDLVLRLAPEPPVFSGGFEGWEVIPRPKADSMTVWSGNTSMQLMFGAVFDGMVGEVSQENAIRDLIRCARGGPRNRPGIVAIEGIPGTIWDDWVIEGLEFGDQIRRNSDAHRIRQFVTITARQYNPPDFERVRFKGLRKPRRKTEVIKVKTKNNTPRKIAKNRNCSWKDIQKLNPGKIKRANQKLKMGIKLRVPVRTKPRNRNK